MAWNEPSDADLAVDAVAKSSDIKDIRDLARALAAQDPGAPSITWAALGVGGTQADGALIDSTDMSSVGWYEGSSWTLTATKTLPLASIIQVRGDVDLSGQTINITSRSASTAPDAYTAKLGFDLANDGGSNTVVTTYGAGGAGGWGSGGDAVGSTGAQGAGRDAEPDWITNMKNGGLYVEPPLIGGLGGRDGTGSGGYGAGACLIAVDGDCDLSGTTWNLFGGAGTGNYGGGGGGTLVVICRGAADVTSMTVNAYGGARPNSNCGSGGGGFVALLAETLTGTATANVAGGTGAGAGRSIQQAYTGAQLTMAMRLMRLGL